jgi:hypothetical protein
VATTTITGPELADALLDGIGNEEMRAATRLLGAHRDGYWLRRFNNDDALRVVGRLIDWSDGVPCLDWDAVQRLFIDRPAAFKASSSEMAILYFATSLVGRCAIQLSAVMRPLDEQEAGLVIRALTEVARGEN